jgi:hypothetical protein
MAEAYILARSCTNRLEGEIQSRIIFEGGGCAEGEIQMAKHLIRTGMSIGVSKIAYRRHFWYGYIDY